MTAAGDVDATTPGWGMAGRAVVLTGLSMDQAHAAVTVVGAGALLEECDPLTAILFDDLDAAVATAATASELLRRQPATVLWLDEGDGSDAAGGVLIALNGKVIAAHTWDSFDENDDEGDAAVMATGLGVPDSTVALRALLRRTDHPRRLLAEAVSVLQLPGQSVGLLLNAPPDSAVRVATADPRGRHRRAYRAVKLIPLPRPLALLERYQWVFPGGVACAFFGRAGLAATAEAGTATDDVIGFSVLGAVSCLATGLAIRRSRRSARHQALLEPDTASTPSP